MVQSFKKDDLMITLEEDPYIVKLNWTGSCTINVSRVELMTFLESCVKSSAGKKIRLDFKLLLFINSAAVAALINFMRTLKDSQSMIDFVFDQSSPWQSTTFSTLEIISKPLPNVRVYGE